MYYFERPTDKQAVTSPLAWSLSIEQLHSTLGQSNLVLQPKVSECKKSCSMNDGYCRGLCLLNEGHGELTFISRDGTNTHTV